MPRSAFPVEDRAGHRFGEIRVVVVGRDDECAAVDDDMAGLAHRIEDGRLEREAGVVGPDRDVHLLAVAGAVTRAYTIREMSAIIWRATLSSGIPRVSTTSTYGLRPLG